MKVNELIEQLQQCDPETSVVMDLGWDAAPVYFVKARTVRPSESLGRLLDATAGKRDYVVLHGWSDPLNAEQPPPE